MANELTTTISTTFSKGGAAISSGTLSKTSDVTGTNATAATQTIGTTAETLNLGDIVTAGSLCIKNLDSTNYLQIAPDTAMTGAMRIIAGGLFSGRPDYAPVYAKANTAATAIQFWAVDI